jgi:putative DNA primase/helicase
MDKSDILAALNIEGYFRSELGELKKSGSKWFARCPFHADNEPSLSLDLEKGLFKCFGCDAGGSVIDFHMRRYGLEFKAALHELAGRAALDKYPSPGFGSKNQGKKFVSLTLAEFSQQKKLPPAFLQEHGVRQHTHEHYGTSRVEFPYYDGKKTERAVRQRYGGRTSQEVKFLWRKEDKPRLYGLWRLAEFKKTGWVLVVEGESDTLTCWLHGVPALGVPGKENYATLRPVKALMDLAVYLWQEPDAVQLGAKVADILPHVKVIQAPSSWKDLSAAHLAGQDVAALVEELKQGARTPLPPPVVTGGFSWSDLGNAKRLVALHGQDLHYSFKAKKWLVWNGKAWEWDFSGEVERRAKLTVASIYHEAGKQADRDDRKRLAHFALTSENHNRLLAMVRLAQSEAGIPVQPQELDADPWLLNCDNGVVDLRQGALLPHKREYLMTCLAPEAYDRKAECPGWEKFLYEILKNNINLYSFIQRSLGYALTGDIREQCFFIFWGGGANGKSTLLNAVRDIMGTYARHTPTETLLAKSKGGEIPTDVARLDGPRFVTASEIDKGQRLAESLVKALTGRDTVAARFLYGEYFDFVPQFKLFLSTNNKPVIRGVDNAIWRRIMFVPFLVQIPEKDQDKELPDKLRAEARGILSWLVDGCTYWYQYGLEVPPEVREAGAAYRAEMDVLAEFLEDCCLQGPGLTATAKELYDAYISWAEDAGLREKETLKQRTFGILLSERGFQRDKGRQGLRLWRGLGLMSI